MKPARTLAMKAINTLLLILSWSVAHAQNPQIQRLGQELGAKEAGLRMEAARALGRAGEAQSALLLRRALAGEPSPAVRLAMVRALRHLVFHRSPGYPEALRGLEQQSSDAVEPDEGVRLKATEALWEAGKKDLLDPVPFLQRNLGDQSPRLRLGAVAMLRKLGTPPTIEALGQAALDPGQPETVRLKAIEAIGAAAQVDPGPVGRQVQQANLDQAGRFGAQSLAPAVPSRHQLQIRYLSALLRDPGASSSLALRAVRSVGQVKDRAAVPVLREVIANHRDEAVRLQATKVLSHVLARQYE
ncbi:MAG: HEAT repeat domain-containing protein [Candidatus Handelsmanbacteria bacterium]|nr:HEAT repeat domain-containing protein [Candidatus Handelsmanbacteria bacterium]